MTDVPVAKWINTMCVWCRVRMRMRWIEPVTLFDVENTVVFRCQPCGWEMHVRVRWDTP